MKQTHTLKLLIFTLIMLFYISLTACKSYFTCDFCGNKSSGEKYDLTNWGRGYVCEDCYDYLWGRDRSR